VSPMFLSFATAVTVRTLVCVVGLREMVAV
jgi:hypothetical protein